MPSIQPAAWVPGNHLRAADRVHALRIFTHRRVGDARSDQDWLNSHLFAVRRDGGLDLRVHTFKLPGRRP